MSVKDLFKGKKTVVKAKVPAVAKALVGKTVRVNKPMASKINLQMLISEKAVDKQMLNQVVFQVAAEASKGQISTAIQETFKTIPLKIRTVMVAPRQRRKGRVEGWSKATKKAYVSVDDLSKFNTAP